MSFTPASDAFPAPPSWPARGLHLLVEAYRVLLAPLVGGHCRYWPSCSVYAEDAVRLHGAAGGSLLAARRLLRCHPFHPGGPDPVPPPRSRRVAD